MAVGGAVRFANKKPDDIFRKRTSRASNTISTRTRGTSNESGRKRSSGNGRNDGALNRFENQNDFKRVLGTVDRGQFV